MEENNYLKDIKDIKLLMNKSSQFISLSGLAGVLAGVYALVGAHFSNQIIKNYLSHGDLSMIPESEALWTVVAIALAVFIASIATAFILTAIKAKRDGEKVWNSTSKRMTVNFLIPLLTGGTFCILLLRREAYLFIAPATLIFYGLACVNASKYTFRDVRYLGITMVIIGLFAMEFYHYGLELWAFGFGICHIIYGGIMYFKYDRVSQQ